MTPRRQLLAAPVLGERGGGIGQVSSLLWRAIQLEYGDSAAVVTLLRNGHPVPTPADKVRFGLEVARARMFDRPDWIFFSHLGLARIERYVPAFRSAPYAIFLHGIEAWSPLSPRDRDTLERADLRVANSTYTAQRTLDANPGVGDIAVCPLALPDDMPASIVTPAARMRPTVLIVGRLSSGERYKGHEQLLRAWPFVTARFPDAKLVVVGEGNDRQRLEDVARGLPCADSVEFTGFLARGELYRRYAEATLFALPSRGEGFGLVYLEAMRAGLPCIGSIHDAASEVIVHGETGVLLDPDDLEQLANTIVSLLANTDRARAMGEAGRRRVAAQFSSSAFQTRMTGLLRQAFS